MATLQKIPPLIDRFAMDDKLNMLADGINNLVEGFGPYLDKAIDAAQDAEQAAQDATNAAQNAQSAIDGANTAADAANAAAEAANTAAGAANEGANAASTAAGSATSAAGAANEAASAANTAAEAANEAAQTANTAASNADEAVAGIDDKVQEAVNERVLAKQYGPASVISASGVCENVPVAGMKVYGKTRQNLWPVMEGEGRSGINVTTNSDGSITVVAQRTGQATPNARYLIDTIVLGKTYTLTVDPPVDPYLDSPPVSIYVSQDPPLKYGEGTFVATRDGGECIIQVNTMDPVNKTFRIMLNEGEEGEPFCPPGLTSVSELSLVSAGKNLLDIPATQTIEAYGGPYTFSTDGDGWVSCSKDSDQRAWGYEAANVKTVLTAGEYCASVYFSEASSTQGLQVYAADGTRVCHIQGGSAGASQAFALDAPTEVGVMYKLAGARARVQLELGSTATAYEPPNTTTTTVDLDGHQLRSLPDGTCDVLEVDGSGAVSVEWKINSVTYDGSDDENWELSTADNGSYIAIFRIGVPDMATLGGVTSKLCNTLPVSTTPQSEVTTPCALVASGTLYICLYSSKVDTVDGLRTWLAEHPTTVIYIKDTPQTVPLGPIAPPIVPAADATLGASSNVAAEIEASLWEPFAEEGGMQQKALIGVAKSLLNFANNEEIKVLNAQFADIGVAIRKGNLYIVIAQGPERTENSLEIVRSYEIPLKANDPRICILKGRVGTGNTELLDETVNIPSQDPSFYVRTGSTPNGYELLFVAYIA